MSNSLFCSHFSLSGSPYSFPVPRSPSSNIYPIGESLPKSLFTFFVISVRFNSQSRPYIRTKFKSWKSWLTWAICATFQLFASNIVGNNYQPSRTAKLLGGKKVTDSYLLIVKFRVFKREFLGNRSLNRDQIFRDNWNCHSLSIFRFYFISFIR